MKHFKLTYKTVLFLGIVLFLYSPAYAGINGQCANCHTMHDSQNGANVGGAGQSAHLLNDSCIGCHTGTNSGGATPFVMQASEPTYNTDTLAGGSFWWVASSGGASDAKGHNVLGLSGVDVALSTGAPNGGVGQCAGCHTSLAEPQSTVAGLGSGCEGCHLDVKHHAASAADDEISTESHGWYRFLAGHSGAATLISGVEGIEDVDWEYSHAAGDHNEYLGVAASGGLSNNSMTAYCCGCHGTFHAQVDTNGLWIRHPSDAIIPDSGEYAGYTVFNPNAPAARPDLAAITNTGTVTPGTDMVMCLSCHRAHGSPNDDMLRWDYSQQIAGGSGATGSGCFTCHTTKDE